MALLGLGCAPVTSQAPAQSAPAAAAQSTPAAAAASSWTIGIARFSLADEGDTPSSLQDSFPRLVAQCLAAFPTRATPEEAAKEGADLLATKARFAAGGDLATKLDSRADVFLQPSLDSAARSASQAAADAQVADASQKLSDLEAGKGLPAPPPLELPVKLWDGFQKGLLVEAPTGPLSQAAKAAGADLLVTGTVAVDTKGYAAIVVRGYDSSLDRAVFAWTIHCAIEDPGPAAADIAARLESWSAGRDYARVEVSFSPSDAELWVDGERFQGTVPVFYSYEPRTMRFDLSEAGFSSSSVEVAVAPGDRKTVDLRLDPVSAGIAAISSEPPGAKLSLDSVPIGAAPTTVPLDGSRRVVTASAPGYEGQSVVLPPSGEQDMTIKLIPSDGQGPGGRIGKAKDDFYLSLGLFVVTIPVTTMLVGIYNDYADAYDRSGADSLYMSRNASLAAASVAGAACATALGFMIPRLIKYLATAR